MNVNEVLDPNWYDDTGATTHMTSDPGNILSCSSYGGRDKIFVSCWAELSVSHAGHIIYPYHL